MVLKCVFLRRTDSSDLCENHYLQYFSNSFMPGQTLRPDNMIQMYIQRPGSWLHFRKRTQTNRRQNSSITSNCNLSSQPKTNSIKNLVTKWNDCTLLEEKVLYRTLKGSISATYLANRTFYQKKNGSI